MEDPSPSIVKTSSDSTHVEKKRKFDNMISRDDYI